MDGTCIIFIFSGLKSLSVKIAVTKRRMGTSSGCILKLSEKFPVIRRKVALVSPQAGQGSPIIIMEGQIFPRNRDVTIKYAQMARITGT